MNRIVGQSRLTILLLVAIVFMGIEIIYLAHQNRQLQATIDNPALLMRKTLQRDQTVPSVHGSDVNGKDLSLRYAVGEPYTLLLWFSPTCSSCQDNFGFWKDVFRRRNPDLLRIVGFCACNPDEGREIVAGNEIAYPVLAVTDQLLADQYKGNLLPQTVLISPEGVILGVWPGALLEHQKQEILSTLGAVDAIIQEGGDTE